MLEKDDNLRLAIAVGEILESNGYNVLYTRTNDVYNSPFEKATIGNESGADLFVSFHRNSNPVPNSASGVETLVYDRSGLKYYMANAINEELEKVGFVNLGVIERPNLVVLRRTNMPALLVEVGFINSEVDNQIFNEDFESIALGIADGIMNTIGTYTDQKPVQDGMLNQNQWSRPNMPDAQTMQPTQPQTTQPTQPQPTQPTQPQPTQPTQPQPTQPTQPQTTRPQQSQTTQPTQPQTTRPTQPQSNQRYRIQVGAFRNRNYADRLFTQLVTNGYPADVIRGNDRIYRVQVGSYEQLSDALVMEQQLKGAGYPTMIVR